MMFKEPNEASYVGEPLRLKSVDEIKWDDQADVVVVGYGCAGACAALEAKANDADVLVVERFEGGGATTLSGGIYYGGATPYQKDAGIEDSVEEMYKYLKLEIGDVVKDETLHRFCEDSSSNMHWLTTHGLEFGSKVFPGKRSYPPKGYDIYYSGNEYSPRFAAVAKPAPRGHKVCGPGYTGKKLFTTLRDSAAEKGVRVRTHSVAKRLIVDADDRVVGVEISHIRSGTDAHRKQLKILKRVNTYQRFMEKSALASAKKVRELEESTGERLYIRAKQGVLLTTGSFAFNREMVRHYAPKYREAMPLGTISCDGSGVLLGQSVGAGVGSMDSVTTWRTISPSEGFVKAVIINKEGRRFIAEDVYLGHLGYAMAQQTDQRAWIVMDSKTYWRAYKETLPQRGEEGYLELRGPLLINLLTNTTRGKTLAKLADKLGVDLSGLEKTVQLYNQGVSEGKDSFEKKPVNCRQLDEGTYYALDISVGSKKFLCPSIPMGGLTVDEDNGSVLRENGSVVQGLFAAGRAAVGIPSGFYVSGSSLADCVFSGRRAGLAATKLSDQKK